MVRCDPDRAAERAALLEVVFGRLQHELATPLLTAAGFARIAAEGAEPQVVDALERTTAGVARARAVLSSAAAIVASRTVGPVDVVALASEVVGDREGATVGVEAVRGDETTTCHGDVQLLREVLELLVDVLLARGGASEVRVRLDSAGATTAILTLDVGGEPWSPELVAATRARPGAASADARPELDDQGRIARAAQLLAAQLGGLWLDPEHGGRLVLRLLADTRRDPGEEGDDR